MSKWFFINFFILIFMVWKIASNYITSYTLLGGLALLFILYNWTRHAVFSTIRSNISRSRKIKFAKLSKKLQPVHKWTGTTALIVAVSHALVVFYYTNFQIINLKMTTGIMALLMLAGVVLFGWLRHFRTTVIRRYIHWGLAYALIFLIILHMLC